MARRKITNVERELMKNIAANIKELLKANNWNQKTLAEKAGLAPSVISAYINEKTLPTPGSVQILSDVFGVSKDRIDPTFAGTGELVTPLETKLRFFEELEKELNLDLTDPAVQKMLKKAAKVMFSDEN